MKNINIDIKKTVPQAIRLQVYKESLKILQDVNNSIKYKIEQKKYYGMFGSIGLCVLLPCVLWDLESLLDNGYNFKVWDYRDTIIGFPELKSKIDLIYHTKSIDPYKKNKIRIEILKGIINDQNWQK